MTSNPERIRFHEGSMSLPAGFEDRTTNIFVPADTSTQPNLSIARDWLEDGEVLAKYIDRQLDQLKSRLPGHKMIARQAEQLGSGEQAIRGERIDASYKNNGRPVHQRQAAFVVAERRALILTASSPKPFDERFENLWRLWLDGYQPPVAAWA